ncbi:unnamed protein product [Gulo gulo]|uniref:Uncharacterized protein n=1 Tax=Gulo gulo TaxID=48420 RepID=A0A9X9LJQ6_GULGU|nr:unnamed protein product [Gulo gulo]
MCCEKSSVSIAVFSYAYPEFWSPQLLFLH